MSVALSVSLLGSLLPAALAAPHGCTQDHDLAALRSHLADADQALAQLDDSGLGHAVDAARDALLCAREAVPAPDLLRYHASVAVLAFTRGELPRTIDEFQAVRLVDPSWAPPATLGAAIADTFAQVPTPTGQTVPLAPPPAGALWVGGRPGANRPTEAPTFVQWIAADGSIARNWLLEPSDPLPTYVDAVVAPQETGPRTVLEAQRHPSRGLLVAGLAVGAAGAGAAGASAAIGSAWVADPVGDPPVFANRSLGYGAIGLLGGGAVLVTSAVVVGRW